jgi:hypothetical protein
VCGGNQAWLPCGSGNVPLSDHQVGFVRLRCTAPRGDLEGTGISLVGVSHAVTTGRYVGVSAYYDAFSAEIKRSSLKASISNTGIACQNPRCPSDRAVGGVRQFLSMDRLPPLIAGQRRVGAVVPATRNRYSVQPFVRLARCDPGNV